MPKDALPELPRSSVPTLYDAAERWAGLALELGWAGDWVEGAIFPAEMVFFLASCEVASIGTIIESGRQDGYSTRILGEYGRRMGTGIVSIDYEEDAERGRRCRERLAAYPIDLHIGDAFELIGRLMAEATAQPIALLVDGPKGMPALAVVAAAATDPKVALISMHNQEPGTPYRKLLEKVAQAPLFYEDVIGPGGPFWQALRAEETARYGSIAARPLDASSLALLRVGPAERARFARLGGPGFRLYQPALLREVWRARLYRWAPALVSLSYRIFRW
jgi:hypothetical protein